MCSVKEKILNANTFSDMMSCIRQVWVMDVDGRITILDDDMSLVGLHPGVWTDNRQIISWMRKNTEWWNAHFISCVDGFYVFEE